ncbi:MAG TPA: MlaD family protein [Baekduia sp.]|nr:MlaD family protein [Baekduia sp.]
MTVHNVAGKALGVGLFIAFAMFLFVVLFKGTGSNLGLSNAYSAKVVLPDAFQLVDNADVRRAGVKIGRVAGIESRGSEAVVTIEIDEEHAPLYRDATTLLRTKTLVGENYLQIEPGHPSAGALPDGALIPVEQTGEQVQLDEILSALDGRTRASIKRNLDGLGVGVAGRARDLNKLFAAARPTLADGATVMNAVRAQRQRFAGLIADTGEVTQAVADRTRDLQTLALSAKATAEAVAARDAALGQTFDELPATLRQARESVGRLRGFSRAATPVVGDLETGFARLRPVVADLPAAAAATRQVFQQLSPFLRVADPMLAHLRRFATALRPTAPALDAFLREVQPMVSFLKPYHRDAASFFANNGAMLSYRDALGGAARIFNHVDIDSYAGFTPEMRKSVDRLQELGALAVDNFPRMGRNSYPEPGTIGNPGPFKGRYPRVEARGAGQRP